MITAEEARLRSNYKSSKKKFLDTVEKAINFAINEEKLTCEVIYYDRSIGNEEVLYNNSRATENSVLTDLGKEIIAEIRGLGYEISLSLYYKELQFVDMRLKFNISWA